MIKCLDLDIDQNSDSIQFMAQANNNCEWMWKNYFKFFVVGDFISTVLTIAASLIYCWILNGHFDANHVYYSQKTM